MSEHHIYELAAFIASRKQATIIVNIGGAPGSQAIRIAGLREICIDAEQLSGASIQIDGVAGRGAGTGEIVRISPLELGQSVVVCPDVGGTRSDPAALLAALSGVARRAHSIVMTTPDKKRWRPDGASRAARWGRDEFERLLCQWQLGPALLGLTAGGPYAASRDTIIAIVDDHLGAIDINVPNDFRPLAIVATYNDRDIALQVVSDLLADKFDVRVLDNWSADGTFQQLSEFAKSAPALTLERFPAAGPARYYEWRSILERKAEIAAQFPDRWISHQDSDELRRPPWPGVSMRAALHHVDQMGFNAIDFTVCEFRPVDSSFVEGMEPEQHLKFFQFGSNSAHFKQIKTWRQGYSPVSLATSGGHEAEFPSRRTFPYKFLLKHYPLRSPAQARKKLFERRSRYSPQELEMGWHNHYNGFDVRDRFVWERSDLIQFDDQEVRRNYLVELISGIGTTLG